MTYYKKRIGSKAEELAVFLLRQRGYRIVSRNYRNRFGEVDVIALDKDCIVFVEVKFRSNRRFGLPQEAVSKRKLERIEKVGYFFWRSKFPYIKKARIDVVALTKDGESFAGKVISSVSL